jgi:hypothetical protein
LDVAPGVAFRTCGYTEAVWQKQSRSLWASMQPTERPASSTLHPMFLAAWLYLCCVLYHDSVYHHNCWDTNCTFTEIDVSRVALCAPAAWKGTLGGRPLMCPRLHSWLLACEQAAAVYNGTHPLIFRNGCLYCVWTPMRHLAPAPGLAAPHKRVNFEAARHVLGLGAGSLAHFICPLLLLQVASAYGYVFICRPTCAYDACANHLGYWPMHPGSRAQCALP